MRTSPNEGSQVLIYDEDKGVSILDVSSVSDDPTGTGFFEAAFFDIHPEDDAIGGEAVFGGAWSAYPDFESGYILVKTLEHGLFIYGNPDFKRGNSGTTELADFCPTIIVTHLLATSTCDVVFHEMGQYWIIDLDKRQTYGGWGIFFPMSERDADRSENGKAGTVVPHPTDSHCIARTTDRRQCNCLWPFDDAVVSVSNARDVICLFVFVCASVFPETHWRRDDLLLLVL
ncbi:hypothetical protein B0H14DRAFT_2603788 [Mycena olivaceomarginata]|nr:hypothetical protein B0H14DRAFT_2603788 [Mycena olivaceomarginata]